tara:strand:+ start:126 stop:299 length:174 start_codon:yes stop_codon:yes gene_type:complete
MEVLIMFSNNHNTTFLEDRYEVYLEQGYSPKEAEIMAQEDLEHENYDHVPKEEEDES